MSPFKIDQMYHFISERFEGTSSGVQEQALSWLHVLTINIKLKIFIINNFNF